MQSTADATQPPSSAAPRRADAGHRHATPRVHGKTSRNAPRMTRHVGAAFLLAITALLGTVVIKTPIVNAANSDWTSEFDDKLAETPRQISINHDGERLGLAYLKTSTNAVAFDVRSTTGIWTQKNAAAIPNADLAYEIRLLNLGANHWVIFALIGNPASSVAAYYSTNDGTTWTQTIITGTSVDADATVIPATASQPQKIGVVACVGGNLKYYHSTDGAATFQFIQFIDDNAASPTGTSSANTTCRGSGTNAGDAIAITADLNGQAYVVYRGGSDQPSYVSSNGASDNFWNVPFTSGCSGPNVCPSVNGGTTGLIVTKNSIVGVSFPHNGDTFFSSRVDSCTTTVPTTILAPFSIYAGGAFTGAPQESPCGTTGSAFQKMSPNTCTNWQFNRHDHMAGNSNHVFIAAFGHSSLCTIGGNPSGFEVDLKPSITGAWATTFTDASQTNVYDVDMTPAKAWAAYVDTSTGQVKLSWSSQPTSTTISRTFTGTNIIGADADPFRKVIAMRTSTGGVQAIKTLNPATLVDRASDVSNACTNLATGTQRTKGIMVYHDNSQGNPTSGQDYIGYVDCTDSGDRTKGNTWKIRSGELTSPVQPSYCVSGGFCSTDIQSAGTISDACTQTSGTDLPNKQQDIQNIEAVPMTWATGGTGGVNHATIGFTFNDYSNGHIGAWVKMERNGGGLTPDLQCKSDQPFGAAGDGVNICTWRNQNTLDATGHLLPGDGKDYIIAMAGGQADARIWRIDYVERNTFPSVEPDIVLNPITTLSSQGGVAWNQAVAGACAGPDVIVEAGQKIQRIHAVSGSLGTPIWSTPVTITPGSGNFIAESQNGAIFAYVDGPNIVIANAWTGSTLNSFAYTSGATVFKLELSDTATTLVSFENKGTDGITEIFDIQTITSAVSDGQRPCNTTTTAQNCTIDSHSTFITNNTTPTPTTGGPGTGSGSDCGGYIPAQIPIVQCWAWGLMSFILVVSGAIITGMVSRGSPYAIVWVGEIICISCSIFLGFPIVISIFGAIIAAGFGIAAWNNGSGGDGEA